MDRPLRFEKKNEIWIWFTVLAMMLPLLKSIKADGAELRVPLYGLFETSIINTTSYDNPFADVELNAVFTSPTGRLVSFFGFYDGDGNGGQTGNVWKQRFMPDEVGTWTFVLTFTDGSPGSSGSFECIANGAKPGPWKQDSANPRWLKTSLGDHFLPVTMLAVMQYTPIDWQDTIDWCTTRGYNTIISGTFNVGNWASGWPNITAFLTENQAGKEVDYERMNLRMWTEWDDMLQYAADRGIYIGAFEGPDGTYGGQEKGKYPPIELAFFPSMRDHALTTRNKRIMRYLVARQAAFWNVAFWSLGSTEVYYYSVANETEFREYGEYLASITPWGRMITAQDCEQWHGVNRRWLSALNIPGSRKLNTVQLSLAHHQEDQWGKSNPENTAWQNAVLNNEFALDSYGGFPVLGTETLWEGQGRANKPLRIIWGFFAAGAHTTWADWNYSDKSWSLGKAWLPVKLLSEHVFDRLGGDCRGDEQLVIAAEAMRQLQYWKMNPHNELVAGSEEAYCLAEPGRQYMIYTPNGGTVKIDLRGEAGTFEVRWLNPRDGSYLNLYQIEGNAVRTTYAPTNEDWVLILHKTHDAQAPATPTNLRIANRR
jgi:hypothetical protein